MAHTSVDAGKALKNRLEIKKRIKHIKAVLKIEFDGLMKSPSFDLTAAQAATILLSRLSDLQKALNATYLALDERDILARSQKRTKKNGLRQKD